MNSNVCDLKIIWQRINKGEFIDVFSSLNTLRAHLNKHYRYKVKFKKGILMITIKDPIRTGLFKILLDVGQQLNDKFNYLCISINNRTLIIEATNN